MIKADILVATHKQYNFPHISHYTPIHVGRALSNTDLGYLTDNTGENISNKNKSFCELTALYWAWKNNYFSPYDYCGLVHYRRYFQGDTRFGKYKILSMEEIENAFQEHDIILPVRRKYYIETVYSHYDNAHNANDLLRLREVLAEKYPEYIITHDIMMRQRSLHLYNMFVMPTPLFEHYAQWLFDILFTLEKRIDLSSYDDYQRRVFGFLGERLLNLWVLHNGLRVRSVPVVNLEGENLFYKAYGLFKRKYLS